MLSTLKALTDIQIARLHELNITSLEHLAALLRTEETRAMIVEALALDDIALRDLCANLGEHDLSTNLEAEPPLPPMGCLEPEEE